MQTSNDQQLWFHQSLEQTSSWRSQEQEQNWNLPQSDQQAEAFIQQLPFSQQYVQDSPQSQWSDSQQSVASAIVEEDQQPVDWQPLSPDQQQLPGWPPQSTAKKSRKSLWVALCIVVALLLLDGVATYSVATSGGKSRNTASTTSQTQASTEPGTVLSTTAPVQWVQVQSFSGHLADGMEYYSQYFTVPDNWQVRWICLKGESSLPNVTIVGYDHSGKPIVGDDKIAAQGNCGFGFGVGAIQKHGGTIQLQIYAQGDFVVIVYAQK